MKPVAAFGIGATAFALAQIGWAYGHAFMGWRGAWMLKSVQGIACGFVVFALVAAAVVAWRYNPPELVKRAGFLLLGAVAAVTVALFVIGPGNLWPIVIVLDGAIIGAAVSLGAIVGTVIGNARRKGHAPAPPRM